METCGESCALEDLRLPAADPGFDEGGLDVTAAISAAEFSREAIRLPWAEGGFDADLWLPAIDPALEGSFEEGAALDASDLLGSMFSWEASGVPDADPDLDLDFPRSLSRGLPLPAAGSSLWECSGVPCTEGVPLPLRDSDLELCSGRGEGMSPMEPSAAAGACDWLPATDPAFDDCFEGNGSCENDRRLGDGVPVIDAERDGPALPRFDPLRDEGRLPVDRGHAWECGCSVVKLHKSHCPRYRMMPS